MKIHDDPKFITFLMFCEMVLEDRYGYLPHEEGDLFDVEYAEKANVPVPATEEEWSDSAEQRAFDDISEQHPASWWLEVDPWTGWLEPVGLFEKLDILAQELLDEIDQEPDFCDADWNEDPSSEVVCNHGIALGTHCSDCYAEEDDGDQAYDQWVEKEKMKYLETQADMLAPNDPLDGDPWDDFCC